MHIGTNTSTRAPILKCLGTAWHMVHQLTSTWASISTWASTQVSACGVGPIVGTANNGPGPARHPSAFLDRCEIRLCSTALGPGFGCHVGLVRCRLIANDRTAESVMAAISTPSLFCTQLMRAGRPVVAS